MKKIMLLGLMVLMSGCYHYGQDRTRPNERDRYEHRNRDRRDYDDHRKNDSRDYDRDNSHDRDRNDYYR